MIGLPGSAPENPLQRSSRSGATFLSQMQVHFGFTAFSPKGERHSDLQTISKSHKTDTNKRADIVYGNESLTIVHSRHRIGTANPSLRLLRCTDM